MKNDERKNAEKERENEYMEKRDMIKEMEKTMSQIEINGTVNFLDEESEQKLAEKNIPVKFPKEFIDGLREEEKEEVLNTDNNKYFMRIYNEYIKKCDRTSKKDMVNFYNFAYKMGCFSSKTKTVNGKEINEGARMCASLSSALENITKDYETSELILRDLIGFFMIINAPSFEKEYNNLKKMEGKR